VTEAVSVSPKIVIPEIVGVGDWLKGIVLATLEVTAETNEVAA
jgi:hypothetical protein